MSDIKNDKRVSVAYEDDKLAVLVKPYSMIVNNADTSRYEYTLQNWVSENIVLNKSGAEEDSDFLKRDGIVHRLDKETSGVIIVAKDEKSFLNLQKQFKERSIKKTYLALVHGDFPTEANITVPVGRLPWNRTRFGVVPSGKSAVTDFKLQSRYKDPNDSRKDLSLIKAFPKTGRTHQIRVHLQYAGFPIYSDSLYAGRKTASKDRKNLDRHFLHAKEITFSHPHTGKEIHVDSDLTEELSDFLNSLTKIEQ